MNKHIWILETFKDKGKIGPAKVHQSWMVVEHSGHLRYWYHDVGFWILIDNLATSTLIVLNIMLRYGSHPPCTALGLCHTYGH